MGKTEPTSLAEAYPIEQARVRDLIGVYKELPNNAGVFAALMFEDILRRADVAAMSGDPVEMIRLFEEMKGCKE